jgi:hypothetical protein
LSAGAVALDSAGNVYVADANNERVRKVDTSGIITTVAGMGGAGYSGDGGPATSAGVNPYDIAVDSAGNVYIADTANNRIRKVDTSGIIRTIAGSGFQGYSGDGGAATAAYLYAPYGVTVDGLGIVYLSDSFNNRVRKVYCP